MKKISNNNKKKKNQNRKKPEIRQTVITSIMPEDGKKEKTVEPRPYSDAQLTTMGLARIDRTIFQIASLSKPDDSYMIDTTDILAHKSDCPAFRFGKKCNHIKRLEEARLFEYSQEV